VSTFHKRVAYEYTTGRQFDEKITGMLILNEDRPWDEGGRSFIIPIGGSSNAGENSSMLSLFPEKRFSAGNH
jgi:hypothetical protein